MKKLICIVGPTASGKTALAVRLAKALGSEVISADSMQIYRYMDIGTAKPTMEEREGIEHHMLDILDPGESYSAAQYAVDAGVCAERLLDGGVVPIVAGGSGLYLDSLIGTLHYEPEPDHSALRAELYAQAEKEGDGAMHARLARLDPESAERLHENDRRRILRALEIFLLTGEKASERARRASNAPRRYDALKIGLSWPREVLYERIDTRVERMFEAGLLEEARALYERFPSPTARQAIGYKELFAYFEGKIGLAEAKENIARESRRYAKRQISWLGRDGEVQFFDAADPDNLYKSVLKTVRDFVSFG
ncbi:MAG: tRNA (adenosine(37)-N6)-dimethylallyltransferase MiaA [Oscillospiraceae bacterium]|nr:tRNA (adenosine(37)-N6)-dimethylallyltransferase MiaA [Oscillospiraceae bacterium]